MSKKYQSGGKKMLERWETEHKKEIFLQKNQKANNQNDKQWFWLD
jgi:hypothetical protein